MTVIVIIAAAIYALMGLMALFAPAALAVFIGHDAVSRDAANEIRAIYGGLSLAIATMLFSTLNTPLGVVVQAMVGVMLLGMLAGRLIAVAIDGSPSKRMWSYAAIELVFGLPLIWPML